MGLPAALPGAVPGGAVGLPAALPGAVPGGAVGSRLALAAGVPGGAVGLPAALSGAVPGGAVGSRLALVPGVPGSAGAFAVGVGFRVDVGDRVSAVAIRGLVGLGPGSGASVSEWLPRPGPVVGRYGRTITAAIVLGLEGRITVSEGVWLTAGLGANGMFQSAGPPREPTSTATQTEPRKRIPAVLPDQATARTRNSLRPESSTKTGDLAASPVVMGEEPSACSLVPFTRSC